MIRILISLFSLFAMSFFTPVIASPLDQPVNATDSYEVVYADFGLFNHPNSGKPPFLPSKVIPLTQYQSYGWVIHLRTDKQKIKWKEEFTLPEKPSTWGGPAVFGTQKISTDGRVSVTEREVSPNNGEIFNMWQVAPGDPKGRYTIRVFIEGALVRVFEFDVQ